MGNHRIDVIIKNSKRNFDYYEPKTVHESSLSPYFDLASNIGGWQWASGSSTLILRFMSFELIMMGIQMNFF